MSLRCLRWVSSKEESTEVLCTLLKCSLAKTGYCALFLSINNSVPALAHLLKATATLKIIAHPSLQDAARDAIALVQKQGVAMDCEVVSIAPRSAWDRSDRPKPYPRALTPEQEGPLPAFIVHSSGSTGFPKVCVCPELPVDLGRTEHLTDRQPIYITHKASCHNFVAGFGLTAFTTLPLFHNHGRKFL